MAKHTINSWIDYIAITAIILVSIGYCLFGASFAQIRIEPHFLNFPIFIGEILLFFCFVLFMVKTFTQGWPLGRWGWVIGGYLAFVLYKAFSGYIHWGPLAFRDAALFYYPLFMVFAYCFWSNKMFGPQARWVLLAIILAIFILHQFVPFWTCTLIFLAGIMVLQAESFWEKVIGSVLIIVFLPYATLFNIFLRTVLLASFVTGLFIAIVAFLWFCKNQKLRAVGSIIGLFILVMISARFYHTAIGKTFSISTVRPAVLSDDQGLQPGKVLFHPVGCSSGKVDSISQFFHKMNTGKPCHMEKFPPQAQQNAKGPVQPIVVHKIQAATVTYYQEMLGIKEGDTLFRYYIWRDMVFEFEKYKPLFGFDFGRPLRSRSLEYYKVSYPACIDGWVGAHNSFLYIIYRAGIIGVVMVLALLLLWCKLARDFYVLRDPVGIGLCAILLNWFVATNFFLILELPYTAIPVWMILGVTLKHRAQLKSLSA